jgi:vanillate O-demethylase ferredoxin subunit
MTGRLRVEVRSIVDEAIGVRSFKLVAASRELLPEFEPGAHIDVHLSPDIVRQYSMCGDPDDRTSYTIAVKREPESTGGSSALHDCIREGDVLSIGVPRNNFPIIEQARHHLLFAGGIGITPLLSMVRRFSKYKKSFQLHYFARSAEGAAFTSLLQTEPFVTNAQCHFGLNASEVTARISHVLSKPAEGTHVYLCGPRPFMYTVRPIALKVLPIEAVHLEHFTSDNSKVASLSTSKEFTLRLARSGREIRVGADQSIVSALEDHGVHVETYCRRGLCGTCMTKVLDGVPDHRDEIMPDSAKQLGGNMMICVSRSLTSVLVLDL